MAATTTASGIPWFAWALLTVICWGTYGVCMHTGSMNMESKAHGRMMAFLYVGLAYFHTAVIAPLIILKLKADRWISGTIRVLVGNGAWAQVFWAPLGRSGCSWPLELSNPPVYVPIVMSIIFADAPMVNAIVNTTNKTCGVTCSRSSS